MKFQYNSDIHFITLGLLLVVIFGAVSINQVQGMPSPIQYIATYPLQRNKQGEKPSMPFRPRESNADHNNWLDTLFPALDKDLSTNGHQARDGVSARYGADDEATVHASMWGRR